MKKVAPTDTVLVEIWLKLRFERVAQSSPDRGLTAKDENS